MSTQIHAVSARNSLTRGNYTDGPCWYCSVQDAGRTALVLGPFRTEAACREWAYYPDTPAENVSGGSYKHSKLVNAACDRDAKSWFYSWGMVKMPDGHCDGVMNIELREADLDMHRDA